MCQEVLRGTCPVCWLCLRFFPLSKTTTQQLQQTLGLLVRLVSALIYCISPLVHTHSSRLSRLTTLVSLPSSLYGIVSLISPRVSLVWCISALSCIICDFPSRVPLQTTLSLFYLLYILRDSACRVYDLSPLYNYNDCIYPYIRTTRTDT